MRPPATLAPDGCILADFILAQPDNIHGGVVIMTHACPTSWSAVPTDGKPHLHNDAAA